MKKVLTLCDLCSAEFDPKTTIVSRHFHNIGKVTIYSIVINPFNVPYEHLNDICPKCHDKILEVVCKCRNTMGS
jgi:hypothetical protein